MLVPPTPVAVPEFAKVPPEAIERVRAWKSENGKAYNMKYAESFRTFTLR